MTKLKDDPITHSDISEYLNEFSNFSFEVSVLRELSSLGFKCEHAGTYQDPITKKTREFDIRAIKRLIDEPNFKLDFRMSVECKKLKENFPLVVHCMPRDSHECYLDIIWSSESRGPLSIYLKEYSERIRLVDEYCPYERLMAVGKACDQVGRKAGQNFELIGNDNGVFDKISQAINSGCDLIKAAHYAGDEKVRVVTVVVPVLVVPNDVLWTVWYDRNGGIEREPIKESNVEYYIDKSWLVGKEKQEYQKRYWMSHLEIVQVDNIFEMIKKYTTLPVFSSSGELGKCWLEKNSPRK